MPSLGPCVGRPELIPGCRLTRLDLSDCAGGAVGMTLEAEPAGLPERPPGASGSPVEPRSDRGPAKGFTFAERLLRRGVLILGTP